MSVIPISHSAVSASAKDAPSAHPPCALRAFRKDDSGTAHLLGHIPHLRKAVLDPQNGLCVVDVQRGFVPIRRDRCGIDVDHAPQRVIGEKMATAVPAESAQALLIDADPRFAARDLHCARMAKREGIDGRRTPASARGAMAITHRDRFAAHCNVDRPAKARALVRFDDRSSIERCVVAAERAARDRCPASRTGSPSAYRHDASQPRGAVVGVTARFWRSTSSSFAGRTTIAPIVSIAVAAASKASTARGAAGL